MTLSLDERLTQTLRGTLERLTLNTSCYGVAVSGGADSLALALLMNETSGAGTVRAFTVDHGLRHGSAAEARWTKEQMEKCGIGCDVLTLESNSLQTGNLQAAARAARYNVLAEACTQRGINVLCTAHTLDDQTETFLARVARGSGTKGLSVMRERAPIPLPKPSADVILARPLLWAKRTDLRYYLKAKAQRWAEDPSNANAKYDRIRFRAMLTGWQKSGFEIERIGATVKNMQRSEDALEFFAAQSFHDVTTVFPDGAIQVPTQAFFTLPIDTQLRILSTCLRRVSQDARNVRLAKLEDVLERLHAPKSNRFTLHGCTLDVNAGQLIIKREHP